MEVLLSGIIITLLLVVIILQLSHRTKQDEPLKNIMKSLADLESCVNKMERRFLEDLQTNRMENNTQARDNRTELNGSLNNFRFELLNTLKDSRDSFERSVQSFNELQREKFGILESRQSELVKQTETKLENIRTTVEEKLEKTLSERLGQSFETVGRQLLEVQKGLGEMQTIATDVGGLKKVLSNVKLRGGIGEVQLAMLLEQILAPNQYEANVRTKRNSNDPVEFAIRLPGRSEDENEVVYLPIDAKFPKDAYEHLLAAYEQGISEEVEIQSKNLEATIRRMARDIRDKYIDPPNTTDFAIMFLPFESIYAEVIRRNALVDQMRDEFRITVAGPTTLAAILNSLQMGFRTLALQKRSSEVWQVLGAVKTEFENFGGLLEKARKSIHSASDTVDELLGKRTRAINRKLKNVEALPAVEGPKIIPGLDAAGLPESEDLDS